MTSKEVKLLDSMIDWIYDNKIQFLNLIIVLARKGILSDADIDFIKNSKPKD